MLDPIAIPQGEVMQSTNRATLFHGFRIIIIVSKEIVET